MEAKVKLMNGMVEVAIAGRYAKCTDYILNVNRGQSEVCFTPDCNKVIQIAMDLFTHLVDTRNPMVEKTLDVEPKDITKVYFHALGDTMVIGILTDRKSANDMVIEHVI